jgi:hypothetical protein
MVDNNSFNPFQKDPQTKQGNQVAPAVSPNDLVQLSRRIKVLEEGMSNLRKKMLMNEQNELIRHKKTLSEQKTTLSDINEVKKYIENIKRTIKEVISEMKSSVKKEEMDVFKKYIDMWNPINFVTESTVEKMIEDKLNEFKDKKR